MDLANYGDSANYFLEEANYLENPPKSSTSLGLLSHYGTKLNRLNPENFIQEIPEPEIKNPISRSLSTHAIMKLATEKLIQLNSEKTDLFSVLSNTIQAESNPNRSSINEDIDLFLLLQGAAQLVANKKFVPARKLLDKCENSASKTGTPTQRVVYYFANALQERIDRDWGLFYEENISLKMKEPIDVLQTKMSLEPSLLECHQDLPEVVICEFTSIQSLFDAVAYEERIHIVDLCIKNGSRWIILMQALTARLHTPLQLLKITAIGTSKKMMDETGERLASIAQAMNVPFQFNIVLSELKDISEDMFELKDKEAMAIFSSVSLWSVLPWPLHLESLLQVMKKLSPCVMVLNELEASMNSPIFLERFTDSLFYLGTLFDMLSVTCKDHPFRKLCEEVCLKEMLTNSIVAEGQERLHRHESVKGWREIFAKFGIVGIDLSDTALYQASYLRKNSTYQSHLTLDMNEESMIIGWEGTPLQFVSAWKFN